MSPEEYEKGLERLKDELAQIIIDAPVVQSQDLVGKVAYRIFTQGKASDGSDIGRYKPGRYIAKRNDAGRRIDKVDLSFKQDLEKSIVSGIIDDGAGYGYNNQKEANIGNYQEERYGKPIFTPSVQEQEEAKELMIQYIIERLRESAKQIFGNG